MLFFVLAGLVLALVVLFMVRARNRTDSRRRADPEMDTYGRGYWGSGFYGNHSGRQGDPSWMFLHSTGSSGSQSGWDDNCDSGGSDSGGGSDGGGGGDCGGGDGGGGGGD